MNKPNNRIKVGIYSQSSPLYGLVTTEADEVFFVGKRELRGAFDGDTVRIEVTKPSDGTRRAEGKVLQILKRTDKALVGTFLKRAGAKYGFVQVVEGFRGKDIFVVDKESMGAKDGDVVTVRVFGSREKPHGNIVSILGRRTDPGMPERILLYENGVSEGFSKSVTDETEKLHRVEQAIGKRIDLRQEWIVTIDGADAKDLDDAISVKRLPDGTFELWVHIADVAEYVRPDTELDHEALERGTSIYFPDRVIPMLPERLSNDLCSLHPGIPKATLSIIMRLDANGQVLTRNIAETLLESKYRFTYDEVQEILDGRSSGDYPPELLTLLDDALALKRILDARRAREGKIEFDFPEVKILVDEKGKVTGVTKRDRSESHKVIEEFMILANEEISKFFALKKIPFLYRVHEAPSEQNTTELLTLLAHYGYQISGQSLTPLMIREIMDTLHEKEYRYVLSKHILTSMSKAIYSDESLGHYGLALQYYSHFTSPIRRYPDLQIHRIIKDFLHGKLDKKEIERYKRHLTKVANTTSTAERRAETLEYAARDIKIVEYMSDKIGRVYPGIISSLAEHGIYVELENGVEGLVFIRDLSSKYRLDEKSGTLTSLSGWEVYHLGQAVKVRVAKTDVTLRRLDFEMV